MRGSRVEIQARRREELDNLALIHVQHFVLDIFRGQFKNP
jgi:hypothetical protein